MILRLAHVELAVTDVDRSREFYVDLLGFVEHDGDARGCRLRGTAEFDAWSLRLTAAPQPGLVHVGFRVGAPADLDVLEATHRARGLAVQRVPAGTEPGQGEALRAVCPDGHHLEFFHEFAEIEAAVDGRLRLPMRSGAGRAGVPPTRIDHVSLRVPDVTSALHYWDGALGFRASELWLDEHDEPRIAWIRRSPRSHDVALGRDAAAGFHHLAYAVADPAALLRAADLLGDALQADRIEWGPSRHGATNAMAMYVLDPDGHRIELYCGDYLRDLDRPPLRWRADDYARQGHSWWGAAAPPSFASTRPLRGPWIAR